MENSTQAPKTTALKLENKTPSPISSPKENHNGGAIHDRYLDPSASLDQVGAYEVIVPSSPTPTEGSFRAKDTNMDYQDPETSPEIGKSSTKILIREMMPQEFLTNENINQKAETKEIKIPERLKFIPAQNEEKSPKTQPRKSSRKGNKKKN